MCNYDRYRLVRPGIPVAMAQLPGFHLKVILILTWSSAQSTRVTLPNQSQEERRNVTGLGAFIVTYHLAPCHPAASEQTDWTAASAHP
jgi:hypothetical protein